MLFGYLNQTNPDEQIKIGTENYYTTNSKPSKNDIRQQVVIGIYLMIDVGHINCPLNDIFSLCHAGSAIHPPFPMIKVVLLLSITIKNPHKNQHQKQTNKQTNKKTT